MAKKKTKFKQLAEHILAGGFVTQPSMVDLDMFRTKIKPKMEDKVSDVKLKSLIENEEESHTVDAGKFNEALKTFPKLGNAIYGEHDLKSVAETLSYLAKTSRQHALSETEDWFDKITVNRNMKELGSLSGQFNKISTEAKSLQERMSALYEDMGHIINRYYDLDEDQDEEDELDPVGQEDDDIDNDGDSDDSDDYLRKRRQAISKAVKKEAVTSAVFKNPVTGDYMKIISGLAALDSRVVKAAQRAKAKEDRKKKESIKEGFGDRTGTWVDRQWGDPLPTLADYAKYVLKKEEKVEEAQSSAQKAAFQKMLDKKKGKDDDDKVDEAAADPKLKGMRSKLSKLRLKIAQMEDEPGGSARAEGLRKQRDSLRDQIAKLSGSAPKQGKWSKKLGK